MTQARRRTPALLLAVAILALVPSHLDAHPGGLDAHGGHHCRKAGWGWTVGKYHYHRGPYAGQEVDYKGQIPTGGQKAKKRTR